jgi:hypothetical protein
VGKGLPAGGARLLSWIVELVVFGVLLYAVFGLTLLLAFALIAARLDARHRVAAAAPLRFRGRGAALRPRVWSMYMYLCVYQGGCLPSNLLSIREMA